MAGVSAIRGSENRQGAAPETPISNVAFARELAQRSKTDAARAKAPSVVVEKMATPLSGGAAAAALKTAWEARFHESPRPEQLSVLVAQWSHETGGGHAMMNYNFGGIKGTGPSGLTANYRTTEGFGDSERKITDQFRAYRGAAEGAGDYLKLLQDHFPGALDGARRGDPAGFVHALKKGGYFTDSEESYVKSVTALTAQARTAGYDAIGHSDGPSVSSHTLPIDATAGSSSSSTSLSLTAVDAVAMADELSRAALRIAAAQSREDG